MRQAILEVARQQVENALIYDKSDPVQRVLRDEVTIASVVEESFEKVKMSST